MQLVKDEEEHMYSNAGWTLLLEGFALEPILQLTFQIHFSACS